jgi:hypothetical protein
LQNQTGVAVAFNVFVAALLVAALLALRALSTTRAALARRAAQNAQVDRFIETLYGAMQAVRGGGADGGAGGGGGGSNVNAGANRGGGGGGGGFVPTAEVVGWGPRPGAGGGWRLDTGDSGSPLGAAHAPKAGGEEWDLEGGGSIRAHLGGGGGGGGLSGRGFVRGETSEDYEAGGPAGGGRFGTVRAQGGAVVSSGGSVYRGPQQLLLLQQGGASMARAPQKLQQQVQQQQQQQLLPQGDAWTQRFRPVWTAVGRMAGFLPSGGDEGGGSCRPGAVTTTAAAAGNWGAGEVGGAAVGPAQVLQARQPHHQPQLQQLRGAGEVGNSARGGAGMAAD